MSKRVVFERSCGELPLGVSVGVHILLVVEQSSLESQSRRCAKTPILMVYVHYCTVVRRSSSPNSTPFFFFYFLSVFNLTYSRWTSSLPSCLWSLRIFSPLPGSRLTIFIAMQGRQSYNSSTNGWILLTHVPTLSDTEERTQILLW